MICALIGCQRGPHHLNLFVTKSELEEGSSSPSKSDYSVNVKHQPDNKTKDTLPNEKTFEPHRKRHTDEMSHEKQDENDTSSETDPSNKDDTDNDNDDDDPPDTGGGVILPKSTSMGMSINCHNLLKHNINLRNRKYFLLHSKAT